MKKTLARAGFDVREDTHISKTAEKRRQEGIYRAG
jgi:hypothetical protein